MTDGDNAATGTIGNDHGIGNAVKGGKEGRRGEVAETQGAAGSSFETGAEDSDESNATNGRDASRRAARFCAATTVRNDLLAGRFVV